MNYKNRIIQYSKKLNINLIGFTDAQPLDELRGLIAERKNKNHLSGFEEKDTEKRIDPRITLQDAKTIIVIGVSYLTDDMGLRCKKKKTNYSKISRSAWGIDYHRVLMEKMERLIGMIKIDISDFKYKCFVDTGPLVDRHLAYKSGIGFYGKNNCIISTEYGSWIFIGYIICNLEIEPDKALNISCNKCNICIENCPTKALMENNQYNAKKCISYLTQTKEDIPYELREKMGNSIYGCDICQLSCPHNRNIKMGNNKDFFVHENYKNLDLIDILGMTNSDFKKYLKNTSAGWRGKNILRRNALISMGNSKNKNYIKFIKNYLNNDSTMLVKYAAWAIIRIDKVEGKKILDNYLSIEENNPQIKEEIKKLYNYYL